MKKVFYLLSIIALFSNCRSNNKQIKKDSAGTISTANPAQDLVQKFGPVINGSWVRADYIEKIRKTKSPLAATGLTDWITAIDISIDSLKGDSIVTIAGYGNHDSGNVTIKFKPGKTASSIQFNGDDFTYKIEKGDTTLLLPEKQPYRLNYVQFIKVHVKHWTYLGSAIDQMVDEALVAGDYNMTDSAGSISKVNFDADGTVTGFLTFDEYHINIDLNDDPMDNLDNISFNSDKKKYAGYAYKIEGDILKLYSIRANSDSTEAILDKLKYTLVRSK